MTGPTSLDAALDQIASVDRLLVALDFDGTLSETVDNPEDARALPGSRAAVLGLIDLAATRVAVVSGRAMASLDRVSQLPPRVALVGSHGSEFRVDGRESGQEVDASQHDLLSRLYGALTGVAEHIDGVRIEQKPSGCGLHTRLCTRNDAALARAEALRVVGELDDGQEISSRYGKDILEFTIHAADKGTALLRLRELFGVSAVVFVGDDVTDEDAFLVMQPGDLSIKVGAGATAAEFRVESPHALIAVLEKLVVARTAALAARGS